MIDNNKINKYFYNKRQELLESDEHCYQVVMDINKPDNKDYHICLSRLLNRGLLQDILNVNDKRPLYFKSLALHREGLI